MDKYEALVALFSEVLKRSKDYHIAYIDGIGYASVIGVYQEEKKQNSSMQIEMIFYSPEEMADSLLQNWKWQWLYENRNSMPEIEYDDICNIECYIPEPLKETYNKTIHSLYEKIASILRI